MTYVAAPVCVRFVFFVPSTRGKLENTSTYIWLNRKVTERRTTDIVGHAQPKGVDACRIEKRTDGRKGLEGKKKEEREEKEGMGKKKEKTLLTSVAVSSSSHLVEPCCWENT